METAPTFWLRSASVCWSRQIDGPSGSEGFCVLLQSNGTLYTVLADLVKCGLTDSRTCLRAVTLALKDSLVVRPSHLQTHLSPLLFMSE